MDNQKHKTSVFSEYDGLDNSSISSKQLENWLKQFDSGHSPKFGAQWTLMSGITSSRYEPEQISFAKPQTSPSLHNQNNPLTANLQHNSSYQSMSKQKVSNPSKSYVQAMQALQKRVKTLEDENSFMKRSLSRVNQQHHQSLSDSNAVEEELREKLELLESRSQKIDDLILQNKKFRETREQKVRKIKTLQKNLQQYKKKYEHSTEIIKQLQETVKKNSEELISYESQNTQLIEDMKKLYQKNKSLEEMKEKSVTNLFEKYNNSIQYAKSLQTENLKLKNELESTKKSYEGRLRDVQEKWRSEFEKCRIEFEKLKDNYQRQQQEIQHKNKEKQYFKQAFEKRDEEFMTLVKSNQKKEQQQMKRKSTERKSSTAQKIEYECQVQLPRCLVLADRKRKSEQNKSQSEMELDFDQSVIPTPHETKSVGKPPKKQNKKSLSSSRKGDSQSKKIKQDTISLNTQQKQRRKKSLERKDNKDTNRHSGNSFVIKSCEPAIPKQEPYIIQTDQNPAMNNYYFSSSCHPNPYQPLPYSFTTNPQNQTQVEQFVHQSKQQDPSRNLDRMMLMELQKELLDLYDEEQNLILNANDEYNSQNERSQYLGRLKQIHEQIRIKSEKVCEFKARV